MFINQNIFSQYLAIWNQYEQEHRNREILLNRLQEKFPFDDKALRKHSWTMVEATLNYYGLNSKMIFSILDFYVINFLLQAIDSENIQELLSNHLGHVIYPARDCVVVSQLASFLQEKGVPIPFHIKQYISKSARSSIHVPQGRFVDLNVSKIKVGQLKRIFKTFDLKRFSRVELGILQARIIAAALWKENRGYRQSEIIGNENFIGHMKSFYQIANIPRSEMKKIRPEWISNLDPNRLRTYS